MTNEIFHSKTKDAPTDDGKEVKIEFSLDFFDPSQSSTVTGDFKTDEHLDVIGVNVTSMVVQVFGVFVGVFKVD